MKKHLLQFNSFALFTILALAMTCHAAAAQHTVKVSWTAPTVDVNGNPLTTDQRGPGFPRIVGAAVDIGAYEAPLPAPATSAFSGLTAPVTITTGTASVTVGGVISAGSVFPGSGEVVAVTLNGVTQDAAIGSTGAFSTTFNTSALPSSATPYQVTYSYAGDTKLSAASDSSTTTVTVKAPTLSLIHI